MAICKPEHSVIHNCHNIHVHSCNTNTPSMSINIVTCNICASFINHSFHSLLWQCGSLGHSIETLPQSNYSGLPGWLCGLVWASHPAWVWCHRTPLPLSSGRPPGHAPANALLDNTWIYNKCPPDLWVTVNLKVTHKCFKVNEYAGNQLFLIKKIMAIISPHKPFRIS